MDDFLEGTGSYNTTEGEYQGEFHKSLEHGTGYRIWPNGTNYMGDWLAGKRHGKGVHDDK